MSSFLPELLRYTMHSFCSCKQIILYFNNGIYEICIHVLAVIESFIMIKFTKLSSNNKLFGNIEWSKSRINLILWTSHYRPIQTIEKRHCESIYKIS